MSAATIAPLFSAHSLTAQTTQQGGLPRAASPDARGLWLYVDAILALFLALNSTLKSPYVNFLYICFHIC